MTDFTRLLDYCEKALRAAGFSCRTTTLAYLEMARVEAYRLADDETENTAERRRFRRAADFIVRRTHSNEDFQEVAMYVERFWAGFENGWLDHTMPGRVSNAFQIGRKFATTA